MFCVTETPRSGCDDHKNLAITIARFWGRFFVLRRRLVFWSDAEYANKYFGIVVSGDQCRIYGENCRKLHMCDDGQVSVPYGSQALPACGTVN
jgi:hypothetical protein